MSEHVRGILLYTPATQFFKTLTHGPTPPGGGGGGGGGGGD